MSTSIYPGTWTYDAAKQIADYHVERLAPFCNRIMIVGSLRRRCTHINDIEIICDPKMVEIPDQQIVLNADLFGEVHLDNKSYVPTTKSVRCPEFIAEIEKYEKCKGDAAEGRMTQRLLSSGIKLEIYIPKSYDFWRMVVIRTGSAEFVMRWVAQTWSRKGWRGTDDGLRRHDECIKKSDKWYCIADQPTLPPVWQSEQEFFQWLNLRWVAPEGRIS